MSGIYKKFTGDLFKALENRESKAKILIPHVCNDMGGWGSGFVLSVSRFSSLPEKIYREEDNLRLGTTQFVRCHDNITVANMIAQRSTKSSANPKPIKYLSLAQAMSWVKSHCKTNGIKHICCPRFGSDLAGGNWEFIKELIQELWLDYGLNVNCFVLPEKKNVPVTS